MTLPLFAEFALLQRKRKSMKKLLLILAMISLLATACEEVGSTGNGGGNDAPDGPSEGYEDIKVVDGKVRFYLSERANSTRTATNMAARDWEKSKVELNGKSYAINLDDAETPRPYVDVDKADKYEARLVTSNSSKWYGESRNDIMLPHSQFYHAAISNIKSFPMFAAYTKENGNKLIFNDGFAIVMVKLKGSAKISSVRIEEPVGGAVSGRSTYSTSTGGLVVRKGMDFVALNCTNKGDFVQLSDSKNTIFRLMIAPGSYPDGLKISICDAEHKAKFISTEPLTLAAGDVHAISANYECDEDLVFYEGFDNFVWGGDVIKGSESYGFSPTAEKMSLESGAELMGYEEAFAEVAFDNPGTGFIQPNSWSQVSNRRIADAHYLSDSYVKSRNLGDWLYLYRVQEHPGYVGVGADITSSRGVFSPSNMVNMSGIGDIKVNIRFALQGEYYGGLELSAIYGGIIKSAKINGQEVEFGAENLQYKSNLSTASMAVGSTCFIPSSLSAPNRWNDLEVVINGATDGTRLHFQNTLSSGGYLGIYVDKIEVRKVCDWKYDSNLRVILFNVQNGVCADQHNNYDNFVAWVKKYDPDICVWCESESIYEDKSGISSGNDKYLPDNWDKVAARYGHSYVAVAGNRDNYPQTITSKYPINTTQKITTTNDGGWRGTSYITHGAGHFQIDAHGKRLNIVTCHLYSHGYAPGTSEAGQAASTAAFDGDYFREYEMKYIVRKTINHPSYAGEEYWLLGGDTNSRSPYDEWYYGASTFAPCKYLVHKHIIENTDMKDVIADRLPKDETHFISSTYGATRIDFIYASPKMFDAITNSAMLMDAWMDELPAWEYHSAFKNPSDHRPVIVDFKL